MKIRHAQLKDSKAILKILLNTPELQGAGEKDAVYTDAYVLDCIKDKKMNLVLVAEEDKELVGLLIAEIWKDKKYSFFVNFAVLPKHRGKGIGAKLHQAYEDYCKEKGLRIITALVHKTNLNMQRFCENRNYKKGYELYFYEKEL